MQIGLLQILKTEITKLLLLDPAVTPTGFQSCHL